MTRARGGGVKGRTRRKGKVRGGSREGDKEKTDDGRGR